MAKYVTNASGAMLLLNLIQATESISGSVVPLAMFHLTIAHILRQFVLSQFFSRLNRSDHKTERLHAVNLTFKVMEYCIMMQP